MKVFLKRKRRLSLLVLAFLIFVMSGCAEKEVKIETSHKADKINVVTTIFPQYDFVREIAGDKVELKMLLKPGEESHSYEPTPQDIIAIQESDLFIYVGGENDAWVDDILSSVKRETGKTLRLVDCVDVVDEEHIEGMKEERGGHTEEEGGGTDEHVWTSPKNAVKIVDNITELLCSVDTQNAEEYRQSAAAYIKKLDALDAEFEEVVSQSTHNPLLFGDRFPFRYFADAYGLDYYAAFPGCASDTEPSAATMAFLINKVKDEKIPVVLKMELSSDNIANAIAEATGTEVRVFYSCHNITSSQFEEGVTYLSLMEENVVTLKEAQRDGTD